MTKRRKLVGCGCAALVMIALGWSIVGWPVIRALYLSSRHMFVRETTQFAIPDSTFELQHSRIGVNAIVAEYDRDITYIQNGVVGKTTPLALDTCGGYPINCYQIQNGTSTFVRLDDAVSEHILDLGSQVTYAITRYNDAPYFGVQTDKHIHGGWSMINGDPSTLKVTIGGKEAKPLN